MSYLFDSNVFIYHLNGSLNEHGQALLLDGILNAGAYSLISRIEVLGYPQSDNQVKAANDLFSKLSEIPISEQVVERAIALRVIRKIKIPDAIVAASALAMELPLVTRNARDFTGIQGLMIIDPFDETRL
jgi:predicted nucleic acid-binding protein